MSNADKIDQYLSNFSFNIPDQMFYISVKNLRPLTQHFMVMDDQDWSPKCKILGGNIGDSLITDSSGSIQFEFYWSNENIGALGLNSVLSNLFAGVTIGNKVWCLTDVTGTSQARKTLFTNFNKPSTFVDLTVGSALSSGASSADGYGLLTGGLAPKAQSFYVDPKTVQNASEIFMSSFSLYNKVKPNATNNISGINRPGVSIYLVPTLNNVPVFGLISDYPMGRCEYESITPSLDSMTSTHFSLNFPALISTGVHYAVVIVPDGNEQFTFWSETVGDVNVIDGSIVASLANQFNGSYFELSSAADSWLPISTVALKFNAYCAKMSNPGSNIFNIHINSVEFIQYDVFGSLGLLYGGEKVYQNKGSAKGT